MKISGSQDRLALVFLVLVFALVACSREEPAENDIAPTETPSPTSTARPVATATSPPPTATPTPEPIVPAVSVADQVLKEDGELTIDHVTASEPGWLAIHADSDGETGDVLGYTAVVEGDNEDLTITVDPLQASPILHAVLHADDGTAGTFEFPGPDDTVRIESEVVMSTFEVDIEAIVPAVTVSDQDVTEEGLVTIERVAASTPGWLAVHNDEDGEPGRMLAFAPVDQGENENLILTINWREATPTLHALLYEDVGEANHFEYPESDPLVLVNDNPIASSFTAMLPPDIFVLDQPVIDGTLVVERAISYGPGWLVVYYDEDDGLGKIIGWAPLEDGVNERIAVPVTESAVTPLLHLMIHQDTETIGEFDFPGSDPAVMYQERLPGPVTFRTDGGNYLITRDQRLSASDTITVPLVIADTDVWVVVRADASGEPGEILGQSWVPAGISRDVVVPIDPDLITTTLHAVMHLDADSPQEFDFPEGFDIPLQRNRNVIRAPFSLLAGTGDDL